MATSAIKYTFPKTKNHQQCSTLDQIKTYIQTSVNNVSVRAITNISIQTTANITNFRIWGLYNGWLFVPDTTHYFALVISQYADAVVIAYSEGTWTINPLASAV